MTADEIVVSFYPPFSPNAFLYETHKDKVEYKSFEEDGKSKIYAWAIRDILSENE